jgi:saccharopine dehydrogenase (NAD+, L-lysine forming)
MRVLVVGSGGVGAAFASIAARRPVFEQIIVADIDAARAARASARADSPRVVSTRVDASDRLDLVELARTARIDLVVNACDPRLNPPIFDSAFEAGCHYLDMAMHMSVPHPTDPYHQTGVMLGDAQFAVSTEWEERGQLALVGMGVEPGFSDVAWFTTAPFSEPETFVFPEGIGPLGCVNVEHEEVILMPRWLDVGRVTFKYGLGEEFLEVLAMLHKLGLDSTRPVTVRGVDVSPRDVVAAVLPNPAELGDRMRGRTCAGSLVRGIGIDGRARETYLYHLVDNEWTMREFGHQAVVWQTAVHPVVAVELVATGAWLGAGVRGPEAFSADPFLELLAEHRVPHVVEERTPSLG